MGASTSPGRSRTAEDRITVELLDLAHASLSTPDLAGVLAGTSRAADAHLGAAGDGGTVVGGRPPMSSAGRAYLAVIEDVLAGAARRHGPLTPASREIRRALDDHAHEVAARPRGACVLPEATAAPPA